MHLYIGSYAAYCNGSRFRGERKGVTYRHMSSSLLLYAVKLLSGPSLGFFKCYYLVQVGVFLMLLSGPSLFFNL